MGINLRDLDINEKVLFIYNFFRSETQSMDLHLSIGNLPELKETLVKTDPDKLESILTNLVKNAIKYTRKGSIELGYEKKGEFIEFYVKDTGIGIPPDRQQAIFERFIQADISDKMAFQGAGLGLSISRAYVEMLGGKLWVESVVGKGSVFWFTIPYPNEPESQN
jgi:signal transduction histidine kinase